MSDISHTPDVIDPHGVLDTDSRKMVERLVRDPFLDPAFTVPQMREAFEAFYSAMYAGRARTADSRDVIIEGRHGPVPLRIYHPRGEAVGPLPVFVFIHGGGSIMGSLESYDAVCQELCSGSGCVVVSVDYRLAPEHPYAQAVDDCYDAAVWVHTNARALGGDPDRLAVGGESGGGGLAASLAQMARDEGGPPIRFQLLIYPFVGSRAPSGSMAEFGKGYVFDAEDLEMFIDLNFPDREHLKDWRVSPIWAENLENLPPTFMLTASADILRDDAEDYARRLAEAGVQVELSRYDGTIHGFVVMAGEIEAGRRALAECGRRLRDALAGQA
ncbi:MAG: alpha/beta hydrolase [Caulobacter sp.]|nr:alpha/beta hydrolase [Caulobacter sp.]